MVDWEITVTTVYCNSIDEEVTLVVNEDGAWRCTGQQRYDQPGKDAARLLKRKSKMTGKSLNCLGKKCPAAKGYWDGLLSESK